MRDWASTTYIASMEGIDEFGSMLRWEALRRGMVLAGKVVRLIDGATGLENMGFISFKDALQIKELHYFVENVERMQYGTFRRQGYFIGSGVIEAGCKTVIGGRCKQSGMFWGKPGAEHILALRCINASERDAEFRTHRLAQLAARRTSATRAA